MLNIDYKDTFLKKISRIKDKNIKEKVKKQIKKIIENPKMGKPMRFSRKGTRELYIKPFRLGYAYLEKENKLIFLDIYHKKFQ